MLTNLQLKKFRHHFQLLDEDSSGILQWNDFEALLDRLKNARGWEADSERLSKVRECYHGLWSALRDHASGSDVDGVTLDGWLSYHQEALCDSQVLLQVSPLYEQLVMSMTQFVQESLDDDGDGEITVKEYTQFSQAFGVPEADSLETFKALDRNRDGVLTKAEILDLILEYYCSDDPKAPGNQFFGVLPV